MIMTTERQPDVPARDGSFWTSATGIVSAVAALITALVGAAALLYTVRSGQSADPTVKDPAGALSRTSAPAGGPATSHAQPPADAGTKIYDDDLIISNDSVDLDGNPRPVRHPTGLGADIYSAGPTMWGMGGAQIMKWTGPDPGREDCAGKVATLDEESVTVDVGTRVCLKTDGGRIVFFKVLSAVPNSSDWKVHAVIWAAE
jgi:hypothetical protein